MKFFIRHSESNNFFRIAFFLLLLPSSLFSQPGTWVAVYGGNNFDRGRGICQTHDNGLVVAGSTASYSTGATDFYLLKTDSAGKFKWAKTFGGINVEEAWSVQQVNDSGFVLCGFTNSFGNGGYDVFLIKADSEGNLQWQKTYGSNDWDFAYWAEQTYDGGYILAGETYSFGQNQRAYLIKTNATGDTLWTKIFGTSGETFFREVHQTADSSYIAAGTITYASGDMDFYFVKTDSDGNLQWEKTYGSSAVEKCNSVSLCADGGFALGGYRDTNNQHKTFFIRIDSDGNTLFEKAEMTGAGNRYINRIRETIEGDLILLQTTDAGGMGGDEIRFDKYNSGGWFLWARSLGGVFNDEAYSIVQTADSGFALAGYTASFGAGPDNIIIARTAPDGNYISTINSYVSVHETAVSSHLFNVFPNPSHGIIFIQYSSDFSFNIFDLTGILHSKGASNPNSPIDLSHLSPGIYFLELKTKDFSGMKKIILAK